MGKGGARLVTTRQRDFRGSVGVAPPDAENEQSLTGEERPSKMRELSGIVEWLNARVYFACCVLFCPASLGFLPQFSHWEGTAVWAFVVGSVGFLWVSAWDCRETYLVYRKNNEEGVQFFNTCMFVLGSLLFLVGSFLFLPGSGHTSFVIATWMFITGSVVFTLAAFLNVTEVRRNTEIHSERMKLVVTVLYSFGGLLFIVGSVLFLPDLDEKCGCLESAGAWLFLVGSFMYTAGASVVLSMKGWCSCHCPAPEEANR